MPLLLSCIYGIVNGGVFFAARKSFTKEEKAYKINGENSNLRWEISPSPRADGVTGETRADAGELGACQITMMESRP